MKRVIATIIVAGLGFATFGCNLTEKYNTIRAVYSTFYYAQLAKCDAGESSVSFCEDLEAANIKLKALNEVIVAGNATRKQIKEAIDQLEMIVEDQKDSL